MIQAVRVLTAIMLILGHVALLAFVHKSEPIVSVLISAATWFVALQALLLCRIAETAELWLARQRASLDDGQATEAAETPIPSRFTVPKYTEDTLPEKFRAKATDSQQYVHQPRKLGPPQTGKEK